MKYAIEMGSGAHDIHTKFRKVWFRHSKVDRRRIYRHTDSMEIA
jgi:hypothetical protein